MRRPALVISILTIGTVVALALRSAGVTETSIVLVYLLSVLLASVATDKVFGIAASSST